MPTFPLKRPRLLDALTSRGARAADFYFDADAYDRRTTGTATDRRVPVESLILAFRI